VLPWRSCALLAAVLALSGALLGGIFHRDRRPDLRDDELQPRVGKLSKEVCPSHTLHAPTLDAPLRCRRRR